MRAKQTYNMKIHAAFRRGYAAGAEGTIIDTLAMVEARFPRYTRGEVDAFLNGVDDGRKRDTFRLHLLDEAKP